MLGAGSPDEERLLDAAQHGDLVTVCQLAGKGTVNINCRNNQGWSPLYWAVMCNHLPVVRFLLTRFEVSLAISNNFGLTPLHGACRINNWEAVNTLVLDPRCTEQVVNKKDDWGYTPVMQALKFGSKDSLRVLATTPTVHFYIEDLIQVATCEGLQDVVFKFAENYLSKQNRQMLESLVTRNKELELRCRKAEQMLGQAKARVKEVERTLQNLRMGSRVQEKALRNSQARSREFELALQEATGKNAMTETKLAELDRSIKSRCVKCEQAEDLVRELDMDLMNNNYLLS